MSRSFLSVLVPILLISGCDRAVSELEEPAVAHGALTTGAQIRVDLSTREQRITGFGASSAWTTSGVSADRADFLFRPDSGLGLSLLRIRIAPDGSSGETLTATRAAQRGVQVWAAPWSPPGAWKTNGTDNHGGSLKPEFYQAWADRLAGFAASMKTRGVPLFGLSVQNEPDWTAEWETCTWTPQELMLFMRDYLAPALAKVSPETRIIAPEAANWNDLETYGDPLLGDPGARDVLDVVAVHSYGGVAHEYPAVADAGKEFWETEISYSASTGNSAALATARMIHTHLTVARVNAWHYWWIDSDGNSSLFQSQVLLPQAYGLAHFSKFVRPGYYRVSTQPSAPIAGVSLSAFADPNSKRVVVVAINETAAAVPQTFDFGDVPVGEVTPVVTSELYTLTELTHVEGGRSFEYQLPAASITTLVTNRLDSPSGGSTGLGGSGSGGASAGAGGDASVGDAGAGGVGGASAPETGGTSSGGGPVNAAGGRAAAAGGEPATAAGGAVSPGSGGVTSPGRGGKAAGGADEFGAGGSGGRLPQEPFLPGCYCTAAPGSAPSGSLWVTFLPALVFAARRSPRRRR